MRYWVLDFYPLYDGPIASKILAYAHRGKVWKGEDIRYTTDGTIARIQSEQFGVSFKNMER